MNKIYNDTGDLEITADTFLRINIQTTCEFHVQVNENLAGPPSSTSRRMVLTLAPNDILNLYCSERYTIQTTELPPRGERLDPQTMVETIQEDELSMYDRLRNEMLGKLAQISSANQQDTWEDDNDLGWDEPDTETPLTPYEYNEMQEEKEPEPQNEASTPQTSLDKTSGIVTPEDTLETQNSQTNLKDSVPQA